LAKISLIKRIDATKHHGRTGAPLSGPEVTIPFGAIIEPVGSDRDTEKFRYLGELYSVARMTYLEATRTESESTSSAAQDTPLPAAEPSSGNPPDAQEPRLKFERLDAGAYPITRAKVPGGWLIACGATVTFYPDPKHAWDGASLE